jgi:hypothetical protein
MICHFQATQKHTIHKSIFQSIKIQFTNYSFSLLLLLLLLFIFRNLNTEPNISKSLATK